MKTILFNTRAGEKQSEPLSIQIMPDSAVITNRRPFFMPDFDDNWCYCAAIAFRISRLGKSIGTKFADRYFDAMTLAIHPIPISVTEQLQTNGSANTLSYAFDGALLIGDWLKLPSPDASIDGNVGNFSFSCTLNGLNITSSIHAISDYMMLKIGDIIIPSTFSHIQPLQLNDRIEGSLNGTNCLSFKVK